jgi:hypothetical protein
MESLTGRTQEFVQSVQGLRRASPERRQKAWRLVAKL